MVMVIPQKVASLLVLESKPFSLDHRNENVHESSLD